VNVALGFRAKLLLSLVGLVLAVVCLTLLMLNQSLGADLDRQVDDRLEQQAIGAARWIGEASYPRNNRLAERIASIVKADVTIFDRDGSTLGDSGGSSTDLVLKAWPEVVEARKGQIGRATRTREGGADEFRYVAVATDEGFILRLAAPLASVRSTLVAMRQRLVLAAAVAVAVAIALAFLASRLISRQLVEMTHAAARIAGGDYETRVPVRSPDEIGRLAAALNQMAADLKERATMRRDYLANVSHELRTPVTAIQGYSEMLIDTSPDVAKAKKFLETIHRQAVRLGALVEELMILADLEARPVGKAVLEPVDVAAVARLAADTSRTHADESGIRVVIDPSIDVRVLADAEGLERVLQNLIDNAIRYGRRGGTVRVLAETRAAKVAIMVADDGPGIAPEHLPRLFERFYRVDPARSREKGGAGLGLAIVKDQAEIMGGSVRAESEVGRGSVFTVELSRANDQIVAGKVHATTAVAQHDPKVNDSGSG
jgi:signal transduction histidine kinase